MAIKDGKEYATYVARRVADFIETTPEERRRIRSEAKRRREPWQARWFGLAGYGIMMWWNGRRERKESRLAAARTEDSYMDK